MPSVVGTLLSALCKYNPYANLFKSARHVLAANNAKTFKLQGVPLAGADPKRYNEPTVDEVAVLVQGNGDIVNERQILLHRLDGRLTFISDIVRLRDAKTIRVSLDPSGFVSFYDRIESLVQKRQADGTDDRPRYTHKLFGISPSDATKVKERLFKVLARKNAEGWRTDSARLDWRALVWTIVQTYSNSLVQLNYLLKRDDLTAMDRAAEVRDFTYGMLIPYVDFSSWNVSDPAWIEHSIKRCARGFTFSTYRSSDLTESIEVIIGAIEGTLDRLCSTIFGIFSQTMKLSIPIDSSITHDSRLEREAKSRTSGWRRQIDELMEWLGWSTWGQCDPPCKPNQCDYSGVMPTFVMAYLLDQRDPQDWRVSGL
ncbi:hypothetical protein PSTG_04672 [Puccinia striiformis f. sp. tritici PST-78]|uniref:Uncharacterized protein n=1 Tax=Puccinia striiformis f. sp. tritici PST-78 TaxID=1165861 RepID=A0A0L0VT40_9BASI|nr:hypothetical protein PSTG_04672 [Puccinia striiformis f. sp. tritici PST-78]